MNAYDLLQQLKTAGVAMSILDDRLNVEAPAGVLTDAMKREIVALKPELMLLLQQLPKWGTPQRPRTIRGRDPRRCPFEDCDGALIQKNNLYWCERGDHWFQCGE